MLLDITLVGEKGRKSEWAEKVSEVQWSPRVRLQRPYRKLKPGLSLQSYSKLMQESKYFKHL